MIPSLAERLTTQFYEWEILGRGWLLAEAPIDLEPPFTPFFGHSLPSPVFVDDGLHPTVLSRLSTLFKRKIPELTYSSEPVSYEPIPFENLETLTILKLHIPKGYRPTAQETEQFLTMLTFCTTPISLEFIATGERILMQCTCREYYASYLRGQLKTWFPKLAVVETSHDATDLVAEERALAVTDFGLQEEFMRPIAQGQGSSVDPLTGVFSMLDHLNEREEALVQILFNGLVNQWEPSIIKAVTNGSERTFFVDAPEMLPMAKEKINSPLLAVSVRVLTQADELDDAMLLLKKLAFAITNSSRSKGNALIPLPHPAYTIEQRLGDIVFRESHRTGMLLSVKELATFVHVPSVIASKFGGHARKTKAVPKEATGHQLILGTNEHEGTSTEVSLSNSQRIKHTHIIGATGTGKSTLLLSMISQDVKLGNGIAVLDPHGDLIEEVLSNIPSERKKDVIIIDPSDSEFPVAFNILSAHSDVEKEILSSDLVAAFRRLSTSWGDQMNSVFANAILAFLESNQRGTLADLRRFLIEKTYREQFLKSVQDPNIIYYWQKEYPLLKTNSIGPILTRLDSFLRPRLIRNMICQQRGIDFDQVLNSKKILLVKLSKGLIGTENSYLLGTFVVSKIHQAALARQAKEKRNDFFFYIDEFQHFITPSMAEILSGARKYHLGLILAHQDMQQLQKYDGDIAASVIANAGTRICFRIGDTDARKLADGFSFFEAVDLQNLGVGEAIARIERPDHDFSITTSQLQVQDPESALIQSTIDHSRMKYAASREVVEKMLWDITKDIQEEKPERPAIISKLQNVTKTSEEQNPKPGVFAKEIDPIPKAEQEQSIENATRQKLESQHRYLQTLIKKMAEARGFKATIEAVTPDGAGKVDVLLERQDLSIACEISVTTDPGWEVHNLQKCLSAGYGMVVSIFTDRKGKEKMQQKLKEIFTQAELQKLRVFEPEQFFMLLDEMITPISAAETTVKGYRVKIEYDKITPEEMKRKRESVAKIVVDSLKKFKGK